MKRTAVHGVAVQVFLIFCWSRSEQWQQHLLLIDSIGGPSTITISARRLLTMIFPLFGFNLRFPLMFAQTQKRHAYRYPFCCFWRLPPVNYDIMDSTHKSTSLINACVLGLRLHWCALCMLCEKSIAIYCIISTNLPPWHICQDPTS